MNTDNKSISGYPGVKKDWKVSTPKDSTQKSMVHKNAEHELAEDVEKRLDSYLDFEYRADKGVIESFKFFLSEELKLERQKVLEEVREKVIGEENGFVEPTMQYWGGRNYAGARAQDELRARQRKLLSTLEKE